MTPPKVLVADSISKSGIDELSRDGALDVAIKTGLNETELVDQIPIIVSLMQSGNSRINRHGVRQQPAAAVPPVTCSNRDAGELGQKGGFKSILKKIGVQNRTQAALWALGQGMATASPSHRVGSTPLPYRPLPAFAQSGGEL